MSAPLQRDQQRLGRQLKLRDLDVLLTVTRCGSMGKAAAQLSISQPAISRAIAEMEYRIGVRLLDRLPHGVEPTIYGRALLDHGLVAFDALRQAVKHIEFLADPTAGELRIGSSIVLAGGFVAAVIDRLSRRYPRLVFHLTAGESSAIYGALEKREVDLAVVGIFRPVAEQQMTTEILYHHDYVVAAGVQNPWARRRKVALADLMHEPWTLSPPDSLTGSIAVDAFRAAGLDLPRRVVFTVTTPVRTALATTGRFLTIVPSSVFTFAGDDRALKRLPIDLPTTRRPVALVTLSNRTLSPVAQLFIDCAREVAKPLATRKPDDRAAAK